MAHKMGLIQINMKKATAPETRTYTANSVAIAYDSGNVEFYALNVFDGTNLPYSATCPGTVSYFIVKYSSGNYSFTTPYKALNNGSTTGAVSQWTMAAVTAPASGECTSTTTGNPVFKNLGRLYSYTGSSQTFTPIIACQHKMECWGASGGTHNSYNFDGKGGYAKGTLLLTNKNDLYVYVGGQGQDNGVGGWNGGGSRKTTWIKDGVETEYTDEAFGGGGATDIRVISDNLYARIIVAGGGGGLNYYKNWSNGSKAGDAGGLCGPIYYSRTLTTSYNYGGTQTSGGIATHTSTQKGNNGSFGVGGNGYWGNGGGGWYGGAGGSNNPYPYGMTSGDTGGEIAGGGGSSFISGHPGCVSHASYRGLSTNIAKINNIEYPFESTQMIDGSGMEWTTTNSNQKAGDQSKQMPNPTTANSTYDSGVGHIGNGYARVTCMPYGN